MIPDVSHLKINKTTSDVEYIDAMGGHDRWEIPVHNKGFVALVDTMPRRIPADRTADFAIVQAARTSYGKGTKTVSEDNGLVRYLMRHRHTTPYEMIEFKFHCKMPLFVARQWIRHRTANVNEISGRYSVLEDDFYKVEAVRAQSGSNKQGSDGLVDLGTAQAFLGWLDQQEAAYKGYDRLAGKEGLGVARELARIGLPQHIYTSWYWKIDLHNLLHFLALRQDSHAQKEIRDYADAMYALIEPIVPIACKAFEDYHPMRGGMLLTRLEIEGLASGELPAGLQPGTREYDEAKAKFARFGLNLKEPTDNIFSAFDALLGRGTPIQANAPVTPE